MECGGIAASMESTRKSWGSPSSRLGPSLFSHDNATLYTAWIAESALVLINVWDVASWGLLDDDL